MSTETEFGFFPLLFLERFLKPTSPLSASDFESYVVCTLWLGLFVHLGMDRVGN